MRAHMDTPTHTHSHTESWTLTIIICLKGGLVPLLLPPEELFPAMTHFSLPGTRLCLSEAYSTRVYPPGSHTGQVRFSCRLAACEHIPSELLREPHTPQGPGVTPFQGWLGILFISLWI